MSRKKKPRMEYRYYEVPEKCPVLVLQGEKWLQNYGYQIDYLHFAGALMLGQGVRPYLGAGIGISRFSAYESETRPSLALALGIQPQLNDSVALRADVEAGANPRDVKIKLAEEIVARFHGEEAAANAHRAAGNRMKEGELPDDLPEISISAAEDMPIAAVLNKAGLVKNSAVARDLLGSGGVRIDGEVVDRTFIYELGAAHVCQAGKKAFARITLKSE